MDPLSLHHASISHMQSELPRTQCMYTVWQETCDEENFHNHTSTSFKSFCHTLAMAKYLSPSDAVICLNQLCKNFNLVSFFIFGTNSRLKPPFSLV